MNKKQTIRLNESQFNGLVAKVVKESVKKVLKEEQLGTPSSWIFSIKSGIKGIQQNIDGLEIAMENGNVEKLLPQFIKEVRYSLELMEKDIQDLKNSINFQ